MRYFTLVLCTLAALFASQASATTYRITKDGGGAIYAYGQHWAKHRRDYFIIDGPCFSSCTMVLGNYPNVCMSRKALLGFHRAYAPSIFGYITNEAGTNYMWQHYPRDIQSVINKHGGLLKDRGGFFNPKLLVLQRGSFPKKYHCK